MALRDQSPVFFVVVALRDGSYLECSLQIFKITGGGGGAERRLLRCTYNLRFYIHLYLTPNLRSAPVRRGCQAGRLLL